MSAPSQKSQTAASSVDDLQGSEPSSIEEVQNASAGQTRSDNVGATNTPSSHQGATENSVSPVTPPTSSAAGETQTDADDADDEIDPADEITPG